MNDPKPQTGDNLQNKEKSTVCTIDLEAAKNRVMGDMEFLKKMLSEFVDSAPDMLEILERAVQQRDVELLLKNAHQLKGAAANLSLNRIAESAARLLDMGRRNRLENAVNALEDLKNNIWTFKDYFRASF